MTGFTGKTVPVTQAYKGRCVERAHGCLHLDLIGGRGSRGALHERECDLEGPQRQRAVGGRRVDVECCHEVARVPGAQQSALQQMLHGAHATGRDARMGACTRREQRSQGPGRAGVLQGAGNTFWLRPTEPRIRAGARASPSAMEAQAMFRSTRWTPMRVVTARVTRRQTLHRSPLHPPSRSARHRPSPSAPRAPLRRTVIRSRAK